MKKAKIFFKKLPAGMLLEEIPGKAYTFEYFPDYDGPSISLTMPRCQNRYEFENFPPFFDGVLPEGPQLEALLRQAKLDPHAYLDQLIAVGQDLVGAVTVTEAP